MAVLQVIGSGQGVGKTSLISALLLGLQEERRVGYYKPFSPYPDDNRDTSFILETFPPTTSSPDLTKSFPLSPGSEADTAITTERVEETRAIREALAGDTDVVLVEGPDLPLLQGVDPDLRRGLTSAPNSRVLLLFGYEAGLAASSIAQVAEEFQDRLAGVVINGYLRHHGRRVAEELVAELRSDGVPVFGAIPEDRVMLSVTVREIADYLEGHWLQGPEETDAWVDHFLIGGNIMDWGPNYFGRYLHQAVITRAERPDIQLASLMCDTQCLVLTGGSEPTEYIKAEALKKGVPIILVPEDTLSTGEKLGGLLERANPYSLHKARHFAQCMTERLDLAALHSAMF